MNDITVYTTTTCPYCVMIKNFLNDNKLAFTEINIEKNPAKMQELVKNTGQMGVPQTKVNEQWIVGFDPSSITEALQK